MSLGYSTYFGGSGIDEGTGIAVDASGNAYVTGETTSTDIHTINAFQIAPIAFSFNSFAARLSPDGTNLMYSTYLGDATAAAGIAVDASGNAYIVGFTSSDQLTMVSPLQSHRAGSSGNDAFLLKIQPEGSAALFSTYWGGRGDDFGQAIAVDATGMAYIAGTTYSSDYPAVSPFQPKLAGPADAFLAKMGTAVTRRRGGQITSQ
jgi:hypothetical protein